MLKRLAKALAFMCPLKVNLLHCNLTIKKEKKRGEHMSEFKLDAGFLHDHTVNKHTLKKKCGFFFIQSFTVNVKKFAI